MLSFTPIQMIRYERNNMFMTRPETARLWSRYEPGIWDLKNSKTEQGITAFTTTNKTCVSLHNRKDFFSLKHSLLESDKLWRGRNNRHNTITIVLLFSVWPGHVVSLPFKNSSCRDVLLSHLSMLSCLPFFPVFWAHVFVMFSYFLHLPFFGEPVTFYSEN